MHVLRIHREGVVSDGLARRLPWPKRIDVALLSFLAMVISLADRINIAVAAPSLMKERGWDTVQMGWVLSGFFIGYSLLMVPVGAIADRYSPKWVLGLSVAWWSLLTAFTPLPRSLIGMVIVRVLVGLGQSGVIPCINSILVRWFPRHEYSRAGVFSWSGGSAGAILAFPLASAVLNFWGWQAVFFTFACFGALWLPFWIFGVTDNPAVSPGISKAELAHILDGRPELPKVVRVPWKKILILPAVYAVTTLHFSFNWITYLLLSWLPTYLLAERHFSLSNMAVGSSLPFLSIVVGGNFFGAMIDKYSQRYDRTHVRKLFLIPFIMAAGALLLIPLATHPVMIVVLLCLAAGLASGAYPVIASGSLDMTPRYAGTVVGFQNCVANFSGILVPVVTGYVVKVSGWTAAFWLAASVCTVGFLAYLCFGQARKLVD
jgi:ACS family glucarate transporter-like MFS transporter